LSVLPILCEIYETKNPQDLVILDNAHAHVAHCVVQEAYNDLHDIKKLLTDNGIHCDRKAGCDVSGGSLGHGIGIGIGLALSNVDRTVHCIVSDGSMMEGSNWEALRIKNELGLKNLKIYCNFNGYSAVALVNREKLAWQMKQFCPDIIVHNTENGEGFWGIQGHYKVL
jgi:transketolase N-terminal domain/subunit